MGPTASGKTDLAMELADEFNLGLINVDSAQVYQELNVGSAKPSLELLNRYPHKLLNHCSITKPYSAAQFYADAIEAMQEIEAEDKIPLLVGGTMLYFKGLKEGLADLPSADISIRQQLAKKANEEGWPTLHEELKQVDPISAEQIKPNDQQRIQRALEVFKISGVPISEHFRKQESDCPIENLLEIALVPEDRAQLHQKIAARFKQMLDNGLLEEVRSLKNIPGTHVDLPAIRSVGYRQAWEHLDGEYDFDTMLDKSLAATRQLAKRQMTWLRSWEDVQIFDPYQLDIKQIIKLVNNFLTKLSQ